MIYFSNNQACLIYIKKKQMAYMAIEGFINSDQIRTLMQAFVDLASKNTVDFVIIDVVKLEIIKTQDIDWVISHIYPKLKSKPIQKVGFIKPHNVFGDVSINRLIPCTSAINIRKFTTIEEAEQWIFSAASVMAS